VAFVVNRGACNNAQEQHRAMLKNPNLIGTIAWVYLCHVVEKVWPYAWQVVVGKL